MHFKINLEEDGERSAKADIDIEGNFGELVVALSNLMSKQDDVKNVLLGAVEEYKEHYMK